MNAISNNQDFILQNAGLAEVLADAKKWLVSVRWFAAHADQPLQGFSRDYLAWHRSLGTPKDTAKWLLPIWASQTVRGIAAEVFGKDVSALDSLGKLKVSSYIRHLMFEKGWSIDTITEHLVDMGYSRNSARPQARRMFDDPDKQRRLWESEKSSTIKQLKLIVGA